MTETPERPELKSCPFCGDPNITVRECPDDDDRWTVACDSKARDCPMEITIYECYNEEQAVEAWNRRASSLGEPVSQEAPLSDTLIKQSRHCNMCDRPEVCDRILPNTGPCGMNDGTPVISSASPLSEKDVALVNELRYSAARAKVNVVLEVSEAAALCDLIARLSASAPSPEDKGSET